MSLADSGVPDSERDQAEHAQEFPLENFERHPESKVDQEEAAGLGTTGANDDNRVDGELPNPAPLLQDTGQTFVNTSEACAIADFPDGQNIPHRPTESTGENRVRQGQPAREKPSDRTTDGAEGKAQIHQESGPVRNIIICGETGVGKSSLVNMILGCDLAEISQDAEACTLDIARYHVKINGAGYILYDTPGINKLKGANTGTVDAAQALKNIDAHLLLFVMRCGRLPQSTEASYKIYRDIWKASVPIALVVTGCENVEPYMQNWWNSGTEERFKQSGMNFDAGCACVCTSPGRMTEDGVHSNGEVFVESKGKVESLIRDAPAHRKKDPTIFMRCITF